MTAALEAGVFKDAAQPAAEEGASEEGTEVQLPLSPSCTFAGNNTSASRRKKVYSIYERGEILTPVRAAARAVGASQRPFMEFRTNLMTGNPVHQHSVKTMACELLKARKSMAPMVNP